MARGPRPLGVPGDRPAPVARHRRGVRGPPGLGAGHVRRPLVGGVVARGVRGARGGTARVAHLRGGVLPGRRAHPGRAERDLPPRPHALRVRDARAEGALSPRHGVGGGDLVPGMVRARRRERPRRHPQPGHPGRRNRGRHLGPQRAEDVVLARRLRRLDLRPVPLRSRGRAPPGPHLLPGADGQPRGDGPAHRPARRGDRVRRGLLRGRGGPRRAGARRRGRGLEGGHGDGRVRAGPVVAQPGALHRGRGAPGRAVPPPGERRPRASRRVTPTTWRAP